MSSSSQSRPTKSMEPTTVTTKSKKSISAYNRAFDQHLADHDIHTAWKSRKLNLEGVKTALAVPRPSLSSSRFLDGAFETFQKINAQIKDEDDVLAEVIPIIAGTREANYPSARNTIFGHLEPLTDGSIVQPKPDIYYGSIPEQLDPTIRHELGPYIIPLTMMDKPILPNFFIEAKGPNGSYAVMTQQARYDGAVGARAIHTLQNHGQQEPVYDGKGPYTFSSTYHGGPGVLQLYAHQASAPTTSGGQLEYDMRQLDVYALTSKREAFIEGATAFRNARDLAKKHRDNFVQAANSRYYKRVVAAQESLAGPTDSSFVPGNVDGQQIASPFQLQQPASPMNHASSRDGIGVLLIACTSRTSYKTVVRNLIRPILLEGRPYASLMYATKADDR